MKKILTILIFFMAALLIACNTPKEKVGEPSKQNQVLQESSLGEESREESKPAGLCYNPYFPVKTYYPDI